MFGKGGAHLIGRASLTVSAWVGVPVTAIWALVEGITSGAGEIVTIARESCNSGDFEHHAVGAMPCVNLRQRIVIQLVDAGAAGFEQPANRYKPRQTSGCIGASTKAEDEYFVAFIIVINNPIVGLADILA